MPASKHPLDYTPVTRSGSTPLGSATDDAAARFPESGSAFAGQEPIASEANVSAPRRTSGGRETTQPTPDSTTPWQILKRGHSISYAGLFVFTFILYFRPYEFSPSLSWLSSSAFWVA